MSLKSRKEREGEREEGESVRDREREREKGVNHLAHPLVYQRYHPSFFHEQFNKIFKKTLDLFWRNLLM